MKAWKLLGLGGLLVVGSACGDSGRIIVQHREAEPECRIGSQSCADGFICTGLDGLNQAGAPGLCRARPREESWECRIGDDACDEDDGYICIGLESQELGAEGTCRDVAECRIGLGECDEEDGYACIGLISQAEDAAGTCEDVAECRVGDDTCDEGDGYICEGLKSQEPGAAGECKDVAECRVGDGTCDEEDGYGCVGLSSEAAGAAGKCEDIAECRVGDNSHCAPDEVCVGDRHTGLGAPGTCHSDTLGHECTVDEECLPGQVCEAEEGGSGEKRCIYGERDEDGKVVATLSNFHILLGGARLMPLRAHGAALNNPNADWVGPRAVEMRVLARGPGADTGLYVYTALGLLGAGACSAVCEAANTECTWSCGLPGGWAGEAPEAEVRVGLGSVEEQRWAYKRSRAPTLHFDVPQSALQGAALSLCVSATTLDAELEALNVLSVQVLDGVLPLPLTWEENVVSAGQKCWTAQLPEVLALDNATSWHISAEATDTVGNLTPGSYEGLVLLIGVSCAVDELSAGLVEAPLVFTGGRLVFAKHNRLYFFDGDTCTLQSHVLQTGSPEGPMVGLPDGRLAVATTGNGPVGREAPRLLMVDASAAAPDFLYASGSMDCMQGDGGSHNSALFNRGLSLLSLSPLRYAAPANRGNGNTSVLVAYRPDEANPYSRCIGPTGVIGDGIVLTPAQADNGRVLLTHGDSTQNNLRAWLFDEQTAQWQEEVWSALNISEATPRGIALSDNGSIWLSSGSSAFSPVLQLWRGWSVTPIQAVALAAPRFSPAAVDSQGRAYVVGHNASGGYDIYLLDTQQYSGLMNIAAALPAGTSGGMVGSPLLGEPRSGEEADAEIYLISGNGRVFAFAPSQLGGLHPLWTVELGFGISPTAQPVLVPNANGLGGTLWVVGTQGQIRGIRIASEGLSRTAAWPKGFRDNCNTSSRLSTPAQLSGCF